MAELGRPVVFTVPDVHRTTTVKMVNGETKEVHGSIHHAEQRTFAGVIGGVNPDGSHSVMLFVPNKAPVWVDAIAEGGEAGQFMNAEEFAFKSREQPHQDS